MDGTFTDAFLTGVLLGIGMCSVLWGLAWFLLTDDKGAV